MKQLLKLLFITILRRCGMVMLPFTLAFSLPAFAIICEQLPHSWQGNWENEAHFSQVATLQISTGKENKFTGTFQLANGNVGKISGVCKILNSQAAELVLEKDPPYFNPCRGYLLQENSQWLLHVFCFQPNENGYFQISSS